ncbi:arginyl-tRNA--protein transferase 1 isoform X3 [Drosophila ananassae]|uniref:arginyl-tRNA--protein transferase 1 isoform X3 n=1 Tax=Drosophila ananassae TaxID=7217 RepID=UPI001CFF7F77|nr:arginyl-tRNA--protein transferase 1 isoform X3 [Drosophila ananassae]
MSMSIVQYFGNQLSKCGYCSGTNCSKSHGMHAYSMRCQDYQDLIDRGWRRCGNYCYKLRNEDTCCPCYTIKCDALEFKLTKSNKRILRRMSRYLRDGKRESGSGNGGDGDGDADDAALHGEVNASEPQPQLPDKSPAVINVEQVASLVEAQKKPNPVAKPSPPAATGPSAPPPTLGTNKSAAPISNAPRKKAKQMRLERRQAKLGDLAPPPPTKPGSQEKGLRDFISSASESDKHKLQPNCRCSCVWCTSTATSSSALCPPATVCTESIRYPFTTIRPRTQRPTRIICK